MVLLSPQSKALTGLKRSKFGDTPKGYTLGEDAPRVSARCQISFLAVKKMVKLSVTKFKPLFDEKLTTFATPKPPHLSLPKFQNFFTLNFWDRSRVRYTLHSKKHCRREVTIKKLFSEGLCEIVAIDCARKLWGVISGRLRNFVVVLCCLAPRHRCAQWPFCHRAKIFLKNCYRPDCGKLT